MREVISLEDELLQLQPPPARLVAEERRDVFSVHGELRAASYVAVVLITTGVGIIVKENADKIGPLTIVVALLIAAAGCYWFALRKRERSIVGDYVLLLGALLLSAAVGFAESQFHLLGNYWSWHFLILAVVHGATAYLFDSRLVLSAALTSLAAWFGVERKLDMSATVGLKAMLCAGTVLVCRLANRHRPFDEVYEHFAALLALGGGLSWAWDTKLHWLGIAIVLAVSAVLIRRGIRVRSEAFILYGVLAATAAIDTAGGLLLEKTSVEALFPMFLLTTTPLMIVMLFIIHVKMKERRA